MQKLVDKLHQRVHVISQGGGEKAVTRHTSRGEKFNFPAQLLTLLCLSFFRKTRCQRSNPKASGSGCFIFGTLSVGSLQAIRR